MRHARLYCFLHSHKWIRVNLLFWLHSSLCFMILCKFRDDTMFIHVEQPLITIHCYPHYQFVLFSRFCILVFPSSYSDVSGQMMMDTIIPSGSGEYLSIVRGENPTLKLSSPRHAYLKYWKLCLWTSCYR